jgi:hypothetical protein
VAEFSRKRRGGLRVRLTPVEVALLTNLLTQLIGLVSPSDEVEADPLASMVGIGTATSAPADPALARLFPDAYRDDEEQAAEFRRYTELGLRESKVAAAEQVLATLAAAGDDGALDVRLPTGAALAWLTSINDLRLTLGTRLDITEDWSAELDSLDDDDPRLPMYATYDWLSVLQETLVHALPEPS